MHKLILIKDYAMTRDVKLENTETGTIDLCFDFSASRAKKNFNFMEIGKEYNCKIMLFGGIAQEKHDAIKCEIICRDVIIGTRKMVKVLVSNDEYYIPQKDLVKLREAKTVYYDYTRKDLIQVNDVIHAYLL